MKKISLLLTTLAFACGSHAQLVAHYNFSGGAANDISGNGLNGTISGGVSATAGQAGFPNTALRFNGTSGMVTVPSNALLNLTTWTITAKVMFRGFYSGTCQGNRIVNRGTEYGNDFYALEVTDNVFDGSCTVYTPAHEQFLGEAAGSASSPSSPSATINPNTWYCLTTTYGNDTLACYINGVLDYKIRWTNQYTGYPSSAPLYIGASPSVTYPYWFNGIMDDLEIWNGVKTPMQIDSFCRKNDTPCTVKDIQYCSSVSTPFKYTFTPTITPSSNPVSWDFGDLSPTVYSNGTTPVTHTFPTGGGTYKICLTVLATDSTPCATPYCFSMCLSQDGAKPGGNTTGANNQESYSSMQEMVGNPYPNPTNSMLNIPVGGLKGAVTVTVFSIDGKRIYSESSSLGGTNSILHIGTDHLQPGTYMIEISAGGGKVVRNFSKL